MKIRMGVTGGRNVDLQRPMLNAYAVVWCVLQSPGDLYPVLKERGRNRGSQDCSEMRNTASEFIEDWNDLSGMSEAMAGNCAPDRWHTLTDEEVWSSV